MIIVDTTVIINYIYQALGILSFNLYHYLYQGLLATNGHLPLLCDQVVEVCQLFHCRKLTVYFVFLSFIPCIQLSLESHRCHSKISLTLSTSLSLLLLVKLRIPSGPPLSFCLTWNSCLWFSPPSQGCFERLCCFYPFAHVVPQSTQLCILPLYS